MNDDINEKYLKEASLEASLNEHGEEGGPFGAVVVSSDGVIIGRGHNMVLTSDDPTAHAEIVAIRDACKRLETEDLSGCTIYSSCEPCPMCLSAIIWANIKTVYYGATRKDAARAGFRDDDIYEFLSGNNQILKRVNVRNEKCEEVLENYDGKIY